MRKAFTIALLLLGATAMAQDIRTCTDEECRDMLRKVVTQGNLQYERSNRRGIAMMADSLEQLLRQRHEAGKLQRMDSLEFTADLLKLRADWHYENANYNAASNAEAERLLNEALAIFQSDDSFNGHLNCAPMIHRELAQLCYRLARYGEALQHTTEALEAFATAADNGEFYEDDAEYATYLDLMSQQAMCNARLGNTTLALEQLGKVQELYPKQSFGYSEMLRKKGKAIMLSGTKGCELEALALYKEYLAWAKAEAMSKLSAMTSEEREDYWLRMRPFIADCYQTESADAAFLYDVTLFSKGLLLQLNRMSGNGKTSEEAISSLQYTWQQIQGRLPEGACAIEFVQYEKGGKQLMGAIVLGKTGKPQWVGMMSPDDFMNYEIGIRTVRERIYNHDGKVKNSMYDSEELSRLLWNDALVKAMGGASRIYFAADGYLHQIAVEYMPVESMAKAEIFRLTSTRRLMEEARFRNDAALVVGGVKYAFKGTASAGGNDRTAYEYIQQKRAGNFDYLPGSLTEGQSIIASRANHRDTLIVGEGATEQAFRTLCSRYPIINISTHGYFGAANTPQGTDVKPALSDETMSQSILAMAGASTNVGNEGFDASTMDGLLSAREMSTLDMSGVDLAVISACQTGLGYVTADGVFGIQRGLKNAGVQSLLVTLWSVSDSATCLLISNFHKNLGKGMKAHQAFMAARESLLQGNGDDDETYEEPQYRNAFIMIDALE